MKLKYEELQHPGVRYRTLSTATFWLFNQPISWPTFVGCIQWS